MQMKLVLYVLALLTGVTGGAEARAHFGQVDAAALTQIGAMAEALEAAPLAAPGGLALAELPERQRVAVTLRHLEGRTTPEIAEVLEISVEAVESLTARGKRALAAILAGRREELGYVED